MNIKCLKQFPLLLSLQSNVYINIFKIFLISILPKILGIIITFIVNYLKKLNPLLIKKPISFKCLRLISLLLLLWLYFFIIFLATFFLILFVLLSKIICIISIAFVNYKNKLDKSRLSIVAFYVAVAIVAYI